MYKGGLPATDGGTSAGPETAGSAALTTSAPGAATRSPSASAETERVRFAARAVTVAPAADDRRSIATAAPRTPRRPRRMGGYQAVLVGIDLAAVGLASLTTSMLLGHSAAGVDRAFTLLLPFAWVVAILANRAYERRFVGVGSAEFERVFRSFLHLSVAAVFVFYIFNVPIARGFVFPALGAALVFDLVARVIARKALHRRRRRGASMTPVIAVGGLHSLAEFVALLRHDRHAGMQVVGACLPAGATRDAEAERELAAIGVPVLGDVDSIREAIRVSGAHTVAVLSGEVTPEKLRWVSWQLEGTETDLVVSPGLAEIGGRRLHIQPVAGLPLLHIEEPAFAGFRRMVKGAFDRTVAGLALLTLAPLLLAVGLLVRTTSRGPALFYQTRVGRNGREFRMVKFRSMVANAEQLRTELVEENEKDGVLFKIKQDPRITPVGRFLRRFSIDELPQLINVVTGSMSLVGPRPPLPDEVAQYHADARRRLLVKPGLTGLWQISGRSDLSWEESVRLDLRYVEDWSLSLDMVVLWKTFRAVMRADGAY